MNVIGLSRTLIGKGEREKRKREGGTEQVTKKVKSVLPEKG